VHRGARARDRVAYPRAVDVYASAALSPPVAVIAVAGSLIALGAGAAIAWTRGRHRAALARAAAQQAGDRPPTLVEGRDVVLSGVVRHVEDQQVAVKVSITQAGTEAESSGSWSHAWTEVDRKIIIAPFLLELADGQLVRVEPPKNVQVADALDQQAWIDRTRRVLSAELVAGEHIFARGRLERSDRVVGAGGYRDVEWGWALRATGGQMLLSSEPLGDGLRQRAQFHHGFAWLAVFLLVATQLSLVAFYLRCAGRTEPAAMTGAHQYETEDSDNNTEEHFAVDVENADIGRDRIEIDVRDWASVHALEGAISLPIRFASAGNWNLGAEATIRGLHGAVLVVTALVFWGLYGARRASSRPWFRRTVNEKGSGRLPEPE
jgi:hypothetical protein